MGFKLSRGGCVWALLLLLFAVGSIHARIVSVAVCQNPPKTFLSKEGKGSGIFFDILSEIAEREGWSLVYVPGSWDESLQHILDGEIDLMPDLAYTSERAELYSFHEEPVLSSWSQIYARKGLGVQSIPDMDGKTIAVLQGSIQQTSLIGIAEGFGLSITLQPYSSFKEAFAAAESAAVDLVATNSFYGKMHAREYGLEDTAIVFEPSTLFFATRLGENLDLLEAIDRHLVDLKADDESAYYAAIRDWTPAKNSYKIPTWLWLASLVLFMGLVFTVVSSFVLKHQVKMRTLELSESNREMESRIILRTAELERAMLKAQESDVLKSAFLATMSHELRTPLNSIIGFTGILLQEIPGKLNEEQRKQLSMVQKSARHLLHLINDVLDISKIEAGQLDLSPERFAVAEVMEKLYGIILPSATAKGLALDYELDPDEIELFTDKRRLEQIVLNLLSNAVKFTSSGSVFVRCHTDKEQLVIDVTDTGIGISQTDQPQLFKPFRQIDSGLTRRFEGTGLGLSICKKLASLLGGCISLQSEEGKGSTFSVHIPLKLEIKE